MKYNIKKNWVTSFDLMITRPIVVLPFLIIAFLEALALELLFFSPRRPLAILAAPVIRKFFGEAALHYPGNLAILPKQFYYAQVLIYVLAGVFLAGISAEIVRGLKAGQTVRIKAVLKNTLARYPSFLIFGLLVIISLYLLKRTDTFIFLKAQKLIFIHLPRIFLDFSPYIFSLFLFLSNVILQAFLVLTIPLMVINKKPWFKALWSSIVLGWNNFGAIFALVFFPFLLYLPITLLKIGTNKLIYCTFPEITLYISGFGIALTAFIECLVLVCATQFVLDIKQEVTR
ncbi:MAG: hypothetical protein V1662_03835 [Candidatus Omnitrophota bacterium]